MIKTEKERDNMTKVATMGTSSCAVLALQEFKTFTRDSSLDGMYKHNPLGMTCQIDANNSYLEGKVSVEEWEKFVNSVGHLTANEFYNSVISPLKQDLGRSGQYPFDMLMDVIDNHSMGTKYIVATLNSSQRFASDGYWHNRLLARGFAQVDATDNNIGQVCFIYTRNENRVEME